MAEPLITGSLLGLNVSVQATAKNHNAPGGPTSFAGCNGSSYVPVTLTRRQTAFIQPRLETYRLRAQPVFMVLQARVVRLF